MHINEIPYQTSKQAKYSDQYRRMIELYRRVCTVHGYDSLAEGRAWRRLLQAKHILDVVNNYTLAKK